MTTSPDTPESSDLPTPTRGPLALILATMRSPVNLSLRRMNQLLAAGTLNAQQIDHYNDVMRSLQQIARTIEQYAPPERPQARSAHSDGFIAGEISDALDDRFQDSRLPLDDHDGRGSEQP